ncbi:MAG: hypothetical protein IPM57_03480 [Oligoflexia bacterium]|nr:hypothetical protein [Oligoflexia bacterium]
MKKIKNLIKNQRGQGMLEYVLILAVVVAIGLMFRKQITSAIEGVTGKVSSDIQSFGQ